MTYQIRVQDIIVEQPEPDILCSYAAYDVISPDVFTFHPIFCTTALVIPPCHYVGSPMKLLFLLMVIHEQFGYGK